MAVGTIGKYERLDVLGHGTSGVVYLAWDTLLRRNVALKEIRAAGPEMERVIEEARLLERLRGHPNIVEVHSVDRVDGVILIDMELVRGQTLADLLTRQTANGRQAPLPISETLRIVGQVLDALEHAHTRRIVHRDIKPANILIAEDGAVKLTDFGLAEALGTGSVAGGGGTYPYMAPEDFAEEADSDYRSDLWAVGVILYEMLTGKRPFNVTKKKDPFAWKRVIESELPEKPSKQIAGIPPSLDDVVMTALAKKKTDRYPTAQRFSAAVRAVTLPVAVPVSAPPPSAPIDLSLAPDGSTYLTFNNGMVAVFTLDQLRDASAKYWEEGKQKLLSGQTESFLRGIGEIYIADLARELQTRSQQSADTRLVEFLERSASDEPEEGTVAGNVSPLPVLEQISARTRVNRFRVSRKPDKSDRLSIIETTGGPAPTPVNSVVPTAQPSPVVSDPPRSEPIVPLTKQKRGSAVGTTGWFVALLILCLLPPICAVVAGRDVAATCQQALAATGLLSAMLLIAGTGARIPALLRAFCFLPMSAGILCLGALGAADYTVNGPTLSEIPLRAAALLVAPLFLLFSEALTVKQAWKAWAGIIGLLAIGISGYFLRPMFG